LDGVAVSQDDVSAFTATDDLPQAFENAVRDADKAADQRFEKSEAAALVERTIAWLNRCRRLAKDWENLNRNALAFLRLASIRLMLRKLCNPA
jgi:transposase